MCAADALAALWLLKLSLLNWLLPELGGWRGWWQSHLCALGRRGKGRILGAELLGDSGRWESEEEILNLFKNKSYHTEWHISSHWEWGGKKLEHAGIVQLLKYSSAASTMQKAACVCWILAFQLSASEEPGKWTIAFLARSSFGL